MARPKRVPGEKTAYERMEDAFWELLAKYPYQQLTMRKICTRAKVSHNTFYYRFQNLDDMAMQMFDRLVTPEIPLLVLRDSSDGQPISKIAAQVPDIERRFTRIRVLAASGSAMLIDLLYQAVFDAWMEALGIESADLAPGDHIDIRYCIGGMIFVLGSEPQGDFPELSKFYEREVGQGVLKKMQVLAAKNEARHSKAQS